MGRSSLQLAKTTRGTLASRTTRLLTRSARIITEYDVKNYEDRGGCFRLRWITASEGSSIIILFFTSCSASFDSCQCFIIYYSFKVLNKPNSWKTFLNFGLFLGTVLGYQPMFFFSYRNSSTADIIIRAMFCAFVHFFRLV